MTIEIKNYKQMNFKKKFLAFNILLFSFSSFQGIIRGNDTTSFSNLFQETHIHGHWFLSYQYQHLANRHNITLKRGYVTFIQKLNNLFSVRFTQDITLDKEGDDAGNIEMRLKYCYIKISPKNIDILKNSYFEIGMVHRPWLDFEQGINTYRVQGTMFLERIGMYNSADFGATFISLIGGEINKEFQKKTDTRQIGRIGSIAIGIYNGSGYHAIEKNNNKTFESRVTLRPLYKIAPGIKISYNAAYGKGNNKENPDFHLNSFFLSHESSYSIVTAQYYKGKGNSSGSLSDTTGKAYKNKGYSFFSEFKIPKTKLAIFGRYDYFFSNQDINIKSQRWIGGISYYFYKKSKFLLDIDQYIVDGDRLNLFEAAIEINF